MSAIEAWVVDDDTSIRWILERTLSRAGLTVACFSSGNELLGAIESRQPDVLLMDIRMPGMSGIELLKHLDELELSPQPAVIIMTAYSDLDAAVSAYRGGAFEYLPKPFDLDRALALVQRAARSEEETPVETQGSSESQAILIGEAPAMQAVFRAIGRLSDSDITVLITGESGTGKELVARALHEHSPRAKQAFVAVNASSVPKDLIESELFGHEKGAFTGAVAQRRGYFEQAHGGTLFLDEIGDMPLDLQTHLLRVLQDGQFCRVGGHRPIKVDVRVVAATNQNLETAIEQKSFREDLFYRLNVIRIRLPPLRERREDIGPLMEFFLARAAEELNTEAKKLTSDCIAYLDQLDWAGNVRELENLCRWLTIMTPGNEILPQDLPPDARAENPSSSPEPIPEPSSTQTPASSTPAAPTRWDEQLTRWVEQRLESGADRLLDEVTPDMERAVITAALKHSDGHRQEAARILGWGRNTLTRKMHKLGLTQHFE
ncbi:nitrogen regulation protein NR(I) [Salinisphaera sp. USBA-960]|nr:nitrogen regulation protein NR(I) [Salifodinibacter halophilus]NNC25946.1 nitrogen regulation protein NR(I) [Salifodinibacter halophilus]